MPLAPRTRIIARAKTLFARYDDEVDLPRFKVPAEFEAFLAKSGFASADPLATIAGLSPHQMRRVLNGKKLRVSSKLEAARTRLIARYGVPQIDLDGVHQMKFEAAVGVVLDSLKLDTPELVRLGRETAIRQIAQASIALPTPDHSTMASQHRYETWLSELNESDQLQTPAISDAVGVVMAAREYLPGFLDRLEEKARRVAIAINAKDSSARKLLELIHGIYVVWACFQTQGKRTENDNRLSSPNDIVNWRTLRNRLYKAMSLKQMPRGNNDRLCAEEVKHIVDALGLTVADFQDAYARPGYLLMESAIAKPLVSDVVARYSRLPAEQRW